MLKSYAQTLAHLYERSDIERGPGFSASGALPSHGRARTEAMLAAAGWPQRRYPCLHLAGSKGKGSTAIYMASALSACGQRVGLYSQPHLHTFRERFQIDGQPIGAAAFIEQVARVLRFETDALGVGFGNRLGPATTFELATVMAFDWFARGKVDAAVIETGLGGELDATNVLDPRVTVITPLELEHTHILGDSITEIAKAKAGIISPGRPVVSAAQPAAAARVIAEQARAKASPYFVVDPQKVYRSHSKIVGPHQRSNAALAQLALKHAAFDIDESISNAAMADANLPARCEVIEGDPPVVVDCAHTAGSAAALGQFLHEFRPGARLQLVFGCFSDKNSRELIDPLAPLICGLHLCAADHPRSAGTDQLSAALADIPHRCYGNVKAALKGARMQARGDQITVVAGSLAVAAVARAQLLGLDSCQELVRAP